MEMIVAENRSGLLGLRHDVELLDEVKTRLVLLDKYDMSPIERRLRKKRLMSDDLIKPAVIEFKRFMALFVIGHRGIELHSREVDEVWHTFILFTMEYTSFCNKIAGRYIHHRPSESMIDSERERQPFLPLYERYFGTVCHNVVQRSYLTTEVTCHGSCHTDGVMIES